MPRTEWPGLSPPIAWHWSPFTTARPPRRARSGKGASVGVAGRLQAPPQRALTTIRNCATVADSGVGTSAELRLLAEWRSKSC